VQSLVVHVLAILAAIGGLFVPAAEAGFSLNHNMTLVREPR
jgi:hypothetical protein